MLSAPNILKETERLAALASYHILDSDDEASFDDLTRLAAAICETPVALVSFVDKDRQWFKSCLGLGVRSTARNLSFCAHAIASDELLVVTDARLDPRFADNPLVTGEPHVVFYAGAPLVTSDHQRLGTLCIIDHVPRTLTANQQLTLQTLAKQVVRQLDLRLSLRDVRLLNAAVIAERERGDSTKRFLNSVLNALPHLVSVMDRNLTYRYVNDAYQQWFGINVKDTVGKTMCDVLGPQVVEGVKQFTDRALAGERVSFERDAPYRYGGTRSVAVTYLPQTNDQGHVDSFVAIVHDLTSMRALEGSQRQTLKKLKETYDQSPIGMLELDGDMRILAASPAFYTMLGYTRAEVLGKTVIDLTHPEDQASSRRAGSVITPRSGLTRFEKRYLSKTGKTVWVAVTASYIAQGVDGESRIVACIEDITALKEEQRQRESNEYLLRAVIDSMPDIVVLRAVDGRVLEVNDSALRFFGLTRPEALASRDMLSALESGAGTAGKAQTSAELRVAFETVCRDETVVTIGHEVRRSDGERRIMQTTLAPARDHLGRIFAVVKVSKDHTASRKAELQLIQSRKMVALGDMAGGVAHEINNPLAIILGSGHHARTLLMRQPPDLGGAIARIEIIEATTLRIAKIVRALRDFSRDSSADSKEVTLVRDVIAVTLDLCLARCQHRKIELRSAYSGDAAVLGRPTQLGQVLMCLLANALDAVAGTGEPWIEIDVTHGATSVSIAVTDGGPGIPPDIVDKLMQPFFTTKDVGKGTGLGLSIAKGIAEEHGGTLVLDTGAVHTRFILCLPSAVAETRSDAA